MYEEKDWIMRQVRRIAEGLGMMVGKESIKELLKIDKSEASLISDEEIERIIAIVDVNRKIKSDNLSEETFLETIQFTTDQWASINQEQRVPNDQEYQAILNFLG
ncbi:hypothetical protein [Vagococcus silagei]|uniref:Uncharacterized protein n=1 Tax=Vagococcus silagei TaxID=2508885 RepID=A0A4S3B6M1_9ENTE|nr:hypothetical protein [Vagococcus silagei]THB61570.1 hypothetical protein ESZ54_04950 [Vagococcus silagei]